MSLCCGFRPIFFESEEGNAGARFSKTRAALWALTKKCSRSLEHSTLFFLQDSHFPGIFDGLQTRLSFSQLLQTFKKEVWLDLSVSCEILAYLLPYPIVVMSFHCQVESFQVNISMLSSFSEVVIAFQAVTAPVLSQVL